jgi:hypothetical protein
VSVAEIVNSVVSGIAVLLLASIARAMVGVRKDFRRFMAEHAWLLATSLWTRDKVLKVMQHLGMPVDEPPPNELPRRLRANFWGGHKHHRPPVLAPGDDQCVKSGKLVHCFG